MKKLTKVCALAAVALSISACGNLSSVSKDGTTEKPVFPKISDSTFNHDGSQFGSWVNWDNVRQIEKGMNKEQLYNLIGRPHFAEGLYGVHEWDYVFNYRENGKLKVCQYKVLFDKDMNVGEQWWLPNGCNGFARFDLNSDVLFAFDKDQLTEKGQETIRQLAEDVNKLNVSSIEVQGYTDHLGSDNYNQALSQRRAESVKNALAKYGVKQEIKAVGYGETQPVKECANENGSDAEKACLQPNRRVTIITQGGTKEVSATNEAGHDGPIKVKEYQVNPNKTSWK